MTITRIIIAFLALGLSAEEKLPTCPAPGKCVDRSKAPESMPTIGYFDCSTNPEYCAFSGSRLASISPQAFVIEKDGKKVLTIKLTGEVIFGEGVTPTEAAKQFAEALRKMLPAKFACEEKK